MAKPEMEITVNCEFQKFIDALNDALIETMIAAQRNIERTQPKKEIIGFRNGKILHVKKKI